MTPGPMPPARRDDVIVICHGGPIAMPEDAEFIIENCTNCHGFYGASSMERLPTEAGADRPDPKIQGVEAWRNQLTESDMAKVYISDIIDAPIDKVWALARDFNGHGDWHPRIAESTIEDGMPPDQVGCVRNFTLTDGGHLRERLLSFSDLDHTFTYSIIVSPMPIEDYVATFRCTPGDRAQRDLRRMVGNLRGRTRGRGRHPQGGRSGHLRRRDPRIGGPRGMNLALVI